MEYLAYSLCAITMVGTGAMLLFVGLRGADANVFNRRLHEYVDEAGGGWKPPDPLLRSRQQELAGTFRSRLLIPAFRRLTGVLGSLTPAGMFDQLQEQLALAGNPLGMGPREFYGLRIGFTALGLWVAYSFLRNGLASAPVSQTGIGTIGSGALINIMAAALVLVICNYLPKTWLRRRVRKRRDSIAKGLPDALDMLSVCADAGLGFDQSLQRVSEYWKSPLAVDFGRVVSEVGMGVPRREALRNLADRSGIQELSSFVAIILQSDQLGMSITDTLHAQADQMRIERRFRAQEQARKMPLKMLFPLLLFIFPAIFAVILGPMIPVLADFFSHLIYTVQ
ncbi:MAG: type II secretion system F family protein [Anaerolineales bacterium]